MKHQNNIQRLTDTTIHDWYRMVFAYSDKIIVDLADKWGISSNDLVLDPFVGTGTTVVTAKTLGIDAIGTDSMPPSILATRAKTNWHVDADAFKQRYVTLLKTLEPAFDGVNAQNSSSLQPFTNGPGEETLDKYDLTPPKKLPEGWLCDDALQKMLIVKQEVAQLPDDDITDIIRTAMIAILPETVADIGFGPEIYRLELSESVDVYATFRDKLRKIERDLRKIQQKDHEGVKPGYCEVYEADARTVGDTLTEQSFLLDKHGTVDYVITSPPYPAEHDYTRNQRLELVWLDAVTDNESLQRIKKNSIRSNSKNIYVEDNDSEITNVKDNERVNEIVAELQRIGRQDDKNHGFGKYYPRVIEEYFGGMVRHLNQVHDIMSSGGLAGYVVADQASYWQVDVPTGKILRELAREKTGFVPEDTLHWRDVTSTTGKAEDLREEILVLRKP